jgi:hypothetical protein
MTTHIATIALALIAACAPVDSSEPAPGPTIWGYCEFDRAHPEFSLPDCVDMPDDQPTGQMSPIKWCCAPPDGPCTVTSSLSNCDPDDYVVICEWGQSNADGSITCYD